MCVSVRPLYSRISRNYAQPDRNRVESQLPKHVGTEGIQILITEFSKQYMNITYKMHTAVLTNLLLNGQCNFLPFLAYSHRAYYVASACVRSISERR